MPDDPLARRLSQFTPDGSGLVRDALLFAAGRASARPDRRWLPVVGALAASQLLTLAALWWPQPTPPVLGTSTPNMPLVVLEMPQLPAPEARGLWTLRERIIEAEGNRLAPVEHDSLVPEEAPLRAFGPPPPELLN